MLSMEQIGYYLYMDSQDKAEKARLAAALGFDKKTTSENQEKQKSEHKENEERA